jgi:hypothetical protein
MAQCELMVRPRAGSPPTFRWAGRQTRMPTATPRSRCRIRMVRPTGMTLGMQQNSSAGAVNAVVNGAYSLVPGTFNLAREAGRGLGLFGPEESQRFRQEMSAAGQGLRAIANNPGTAARMVVEGLQTAVKKEPLLPLYAFGRGGMGVLLGSRGVPVAPFAVFGRRLARTRKRPRRHGRSRIWHQWHPADWSINMAQGKLAETLQGVVLMKG